MKNKFVLSAAGAVLLAASVTTFVSGVNKSNDSMDDLFKANVEALARNEVGKKCISGGPGAMECSIGAGIDVVGVGVTYECSVTCGSGYYACCGVGCSCVQG